MNILKGKVAIVTGGSSGIGRAICEIFCEEGAKTVIIGRREELGKELEKILLKKGYEALYIKADISKEDEVKSMVNMVVGKYGKIDILVNSAGLVKMGNTHEFPLKDWNEVLAVNLTGPFLCCREVLPYMIREGRGSIINISSAAGLRGVPKVAVYSSSKAALIMFTSVLALEYGPYGIRSNCICPGPIDTTMLKEVGRFHGIDELEAKENAKKNIPLQRIGEPREIAKAVLFLASDESSYVNGSIIPVDGGLTAGRFTVAIGKR